MAIGGKRQGAGRPKGSGKFGVATKAVRIPEEEVERVYSYLENDFYRLPLYESTISAGFPSLTDDQIDDRIDLNVLLIKHPAATFFLRVSGNSMIQAGIHDGDILIVDRSLPPVDGKIVIASINGELTVKRLKSKGKQLQLVPENEEYKPINITGEDDLRLWGVVTNVIHKV
jgi:DNA polymerase V